ncbi:MAG TPA: tRNA (adenosine(37)-N6)-dimethylallyltransferase MiaA [Acidimicrobiia bacterium]
MGPTASGKSRIAHRLALGVGAHIVSADSMQVYRGMDVGTAKPTRAEQAEVPYHLLDLVEPETTFTVVDYQAAARSALQSVDQSPVIVVGGSGLHFRSIVDGLDFPPHDPGLRAELEHATEEQRVAELLRLDPDAGDHVDLMNPRRVLRALEVVILTGDAPSARRSRLRSYEPALSFVAFGLDPGDQLGPAIDRRLEAMMEEGLLEEVAGLAGRLGRTASQAVGYRQLLPVVRGEMGLEEGLAGTRQATMRLARSQRTLFRRDPRISWLPWANEQSVLEQMRAAVFEAGSPASGRR